MGSMGSWGPTTLGTTEGLTLPSVSDWLSQIPTTTSLSLSTLVSMEIALSQVPWLTVEVKWTMDINHRL